MVPVFALAFDVGRYLYTRQEIGKAADAAAVAEMNQRAFRESGELHPTGKLTPGLSPTPI